MTAAAGSLSVQNPIDSGLAALCGVSAYYRIPANPAELARQLTLGGSTADFPELVRAAQCLGLKARWVRKVSMMRFTGIPAPSLVRVRDGAVQVFGGQTPEKKFRLVDPLTHRYRDLTLDELYGAIEPQVLLITRKLGGAGVDPQTFGLQLVPALDLALPPAAGACAGRLASFVQIFALVTPLFFQVVIDKVLSHKGYDTLFVLVGGLAVIGLFDVVLQYLRTYALSHTTNRIDVELGRRLFFHLFRLPMSYFETRAAGQTVARVRELETIRSFLTGQGLFSALDIFFTIVFIVVLLRLFLEADADRAALDPALPAHRRLGPPGPSRADQGEVQPRRREPADAGRVDRRRADHQGGRRRADHADAMGGEARRLCLLLRSTRAWSARAGRARSSM